MINPSNELSVDLRVGDIVRGITEGNSRIYNKIFKVVKVRRSVDMVNVVDLETGIQQDGWFTFRFEKVENYDGEPSCDLCKSECKKDKVCAFYQPIWVR